MADKVVKSIYRPSTSLGAVELEISGTWRTVLLGASTITVSGGDKSVTEQTFIDLENTAETSSAGTKQLAITCTPSWFDEYFLSIMNDGFYKDQQFNVRFRSLAAKDPLAQGAASNTVQIAASGAVTFVGTGGSTSAVNRLRTTLGYGLLAAANANGVTQTDDTNRSNLYIVRAVDDSALTATAAKYDRSTITALSATQNWKLIQHGFGVEMGLCHTIASGNPDIGSDTSTAAESITFQQVSATPISVLPVVQART